jgi:hypothetical protein
MAAAGMKPRHYELIVTSHELMGPTSQSDPKIVVRAHNETQMTEDSSDSNLIQNWMHQRNVRKNTFCYKKTQGGVPYKLQRPFVKGASMYVDEMTKGNHVTGNHPCH